jgi:drug/metabolite transporter (DMT)-like permease
MVTNRGDTVAYLLLTAMAICFGGTWVAGALAVDAAPPFTIAARLANRPLSPVTRADLPLIAGLGLTAIAGYNWLFLTGLTLAPASDGAIIVPGLAPVFTLILAGVILGERLGTRAYVGFAVAAVGLYLVVAPGGAADGRRLLGDLMFLAGALCWGIYSVLARVASRRFDAVSATLYGTALGTAILIPAALLEGGAGRLLTAPPAALGGIAYLALFGTVAAFVLLNLGVARIGAARASAFALLVPIVGVLTSVALLGERLGPTTLIGGAIVLAGLWLVERAGHPTPPRSTTSPVARTT